jgi:hypothetical protein
MAISWLIDSNVLVYAFFHKAGEEDETQPETRLRLDSRKVMTLATEGDLGGFVAQQNLLESSDHHESQARQFSCRSVRGSPSVRRIPFLLRAANAETWHLPHV